MEGIDKEYKIEVKAFIEEFFDNEISVCKCRHELGDEMDCSSNDTSSNLAHEICEEKERESIDKWTLR